ncbi:hypothetical protein GW17_00028647, partial [Ensete ventricosum]
PGAPGVFNVTKRMRTKRLQSMNSCLQTLLEKPSNTQCKLAQMLCTSKRIVQLVAQWILDLYAQYILHTLRR